MYEELIITWLSILSLVVCALLFLLYSLYQGMKNPEGFMSKVLGMIGKTEGKEGEPNVGEVLNDPEFGNFLQEIFGSIGGMGENKSPSPKTPPKKLQGPRRLPQKRR